MAKAAQKAKKKRKKIEKNTRLEAMSPKSRKQLMEALKRYIRSNGDGHLEDPNVTSIGIGLKVKSKAGAEASGAPTDLVCIQFTVRTKLEDPAAIEALGSTMIPETIPIGEFEVLTDVLQRGYRPTYELLGIEAIEEARRKIRRDPLVPGISIGHPTISAGTLGLFVYDGETGNPYILSNWHVLHGNHGSIGERIVQPGVHDDNRVAANGTGHLNRSHLGLAGDCAIATIDGRRFADRILDLDVAPRQVGRVDLLDSVAKSGRTTGTTWGIVRRVDVVAKIDYGGTAGEKKIGSFEIGPDPSRPSERDEISLGGDSGSAWLAVDDAGQATDVFVGLHFAGESSGNPDEHALACYAHAVLKKLNVRLTEPEDREPDVVRRGYMADFLSEELPTPAIPDHLADDTLELNGSHLIPYTHFSVCQSKGRKLPRFVAWNVDGGDLKRLSRRGIRFRLDSRVDREFQSGNELYRNNPLDRGHVARRADLIWGPIEEAKRANFDSFFYTNIAPQHERFNQSSKGGIWGNLENAIFEEVEVADLKISVISGPIFDDDDPIHRNVPIPKAFWKLIGYHDLADDTFKAKAFVLTQQDLLTDLEVLELDEFRLFEVSMATLSDLTELNFGAVSGFESLGGTAIAYEEPTSSVRRRSREIREIGVGDPLFT